VTQMTISRSLPSQSLGFVSAAATPARAPAASSRKDAFIVLRISELQVNTRHTLLWGHRCQRLSSHNPPVNMLSRVVAASRRAAPVVRRAAVHTTARASAASFNASRLFAAGAAFAVVGGVAVTQQKAQCAAAPYTGVPGTSQERSFIVSRSQ
jgi:hypothetical protein